MEFSDQTDLLKLNAALTTLMEIWDENAARMIINALHSLPLSNRITIIKHTVKDGSSLTGYTREAGNVTFTDKETKTTIRGENENTVARVGHYKVKRYHDGHSMNIRWQHFWKSDPATKPFGEVPNPVFALQYSETTLQPIALWRFDFYEDKTFRLWYFLYFLQRNIMIYLRNLFSQKWHYAGENHIYIGHPTLLFPKHDG